MKNFYAILEVCPNASTEVIRASYRALARKYHPDNKETGNNAKFIECKEAHDVLLDEDKRAAYDAGINGNGRNGQRNPPRSSGNPQPAGRMVWVNGTGWVLMSMDAPGPYPGDSAPPVHDPWSNVNPNAYPNPYQQQAEELAYDIAQDLARQMLDRLFRGRR
jgi:DnaJ-class molecular chaperone